MRGLSCGRRGLVREVVHPGLRHERVEDAGFTRVRPRRLLLFRISSFTYPPPPCSSFSSSSSSDGNGGTKDSAIDALTTSRASPETRASVSDGVRDARRLARLARRLAVSPSSWPVASAAAAAAALALSLAACAAFASAGLALNPPDGVVGLIGDSVAGWIAVSDRDSRVAMTTTPGSFCWTTSVRGRAWSGTAATATDGPRGPDRRPRRPARRPPGCHRRRKRGRGCVDSARRRRRGCEGARPGLGRSNR